MIVVGLTGGIGSGKSTVAAMLVERGAVLIDADEVAREVVEPGRRAYARVVERFGPGVVAPDGRLDRSAMAAVVFGDPVSLAGLNTIVHPEVHRGGCQPACVYTCRPGRGRARHPLAGGGRRTRSLRSGGRDRGGQPRDLVLQRLVTKRGMDRSDAESRIANQASREERIARADYVISNTGTLEELEEMVEGAWTWIEGLALGTAAGDEGDGD